MSGDIVQIDAPEHKAVAEMLPWYTNGTLSTAEREQVEQHLRQCPRCRADLDWQRQLLLAADSAADASVGDVEQGWARVSARLERREPVAGMRGWWSRWWHGGPTWTRWALALQLAVIASLTALLLAPPPNSSQYHVLGAAPAVHGNLVVVFRPQISELQLRQLLRAQQLRIVDGPTQTDAYVLQAPLAARTAALQALRSDPAVLLAETLEREGPP